MKFVTRFSILLALFLTACSMVPSDPAPQPAQAALVPTVSPSPVRTQTPTTVPSPTMELEPLEEVSYRGVRFVYNPDLVSAVRGEAIPAVIGPSPEYDLPQHLQFIFDEVVPSSDFNPREPQLLVIPLADYRFTSPKEAGGKLDALELLLSERPESIPGDVSILPSVPGKQVLLTQAKYLDFQNGSGIRFLTVISEEIGPVTNESLFYTFQGLSEDRGYFVALFFPVSTVQLPDRFEDTQAAEDYWLFVANFDRYLEETSALLNGLRGSRFTPDLRVLDNLIQTLQLPDASMDLHEVDDPEKIADRLRREGKPALISLWRDLGIQPSGLFDQTTEVVHELVDLKVNGNRDEYRVLRISEKTEEDWQYLLFRSVGNQWLFVGNIDLPDQKFLPPSCRVVSQGEDAWLVMDWLKSSNPEMTHYNQTWFLFNDRVLQPVLSYPLEGYQMSPDQAYNVMYKTELIAEEGGASDVFILSSQITYSIFGDGHEQAANTETYELFTITLSAAYTWDANENIFSLIPERSELRQEDLDAGFYFPGPDSRFIHFAESELMTLARNGTPLQKRWLKNYLESLDASPERENLLRELGG